MEYGNEKISMIIAMYNTADYIEKCLGSILTQTYKDLEVIIVNDGSTDNSLSIVKKIAESDSRIIVIDQKNQGVSAARNTGLDCISGKYVCFIDSDDYVEPDFVSSLYTLIKENNAQQSSCRRIYESVSRPKKVKNKKENIRLISGVEGVKELFIDSYYSCCAADKMFVVDIVGNQRFSIKTNLGEDLWFLYEYLKKVDTVATTDRELYHYIQHKKSAVNGLFKPSRMVLIDTLNTVADDVKINFPEAYAYAKNWIFLVHIEMLHFMKKWRYKDKSLKKVLKDGLKEHYKYNKKVRRDYASYRRIAHWIYPLFLLL